MTSEAFFRVTGRILSGTAAFVACLQLRKKILDLSGSHQEKGYKAMYLFWPERNADQMRGACIMLQEWIKVRSNSWNIERGWETVLLPDSNIIYGVPKKTRWCPKFRELLFEVVILNRWYMLRKFLSFLCSRTALQLLSFRSIVTRRYALQLLSFRYIVTRRQVAFYLCKIFSRSGVIHGQKERRQLAHWHSRAGVIKCCFKSLVPFLPHSFQTESFQHWEFLSQRIEEHFCSSISNVPLNIFRTRRVLSSKSDKSVNSTVWSVDRHNKKWRRAGRVCENDIYNLAILSSE